MKYRNSCWYDEEAIRCADHIIDIGPGAGKHGGGCAQKLKDILKSKNLWLLHFICKRKIIFLKALKAIIEIVEALK